MLNHSVPAFTTLSMMNERKGTQASWDADSSTVLRTDYGSTDTKKSLTQQWFMQLITEQSDLGQRGCNFYQDGGWDIPFLQGPKRLSLGIVVERQITLSF